MVNMWQVTQLTRRLALLAGVMPRNQHNLILDWTELHQEELIENWLLIGQNQLPNKIAGL
jgi:hypothetical protein